MSVLRGVGLSSGMSGLCISEISMIFYFLQMHFSKSKLALNLNEVKADATKLPDSD